MPSRSNDQPITPWGAFAMFWLLLAAIVASSIPMMLGVAITAPIPWLGELKSFTPWHILHFLWMYPLLWCTGAVSEPTIKYLFSANPDSRLAQFIDDSISCLAIALMYYIVFFQHPLGAIFAATISVLVMKFYVEWSEKRSPPDDSESDDPEITGTGNH